MSDRTVPERINEFLVRCAGRAYCDHCIQERLGLRWRQQVQLVTATLAVTACFRRELAVCSTCDESKQVISFLGSVVKSSAQETLSLPKMSLAVAESRRRRAFSKDRPTGDVNDVHIPGDRRLDPQI